MSEYTQEEKRFESRDYDQMRKMGMHPAVYVRSMEGGLGWHKLHPDDDESPEVYASIEAIQAFVTYHDAVVSSLMKPIPAPQPPASKVKEVTEKQFNDFGYPSGLVAYQARQSGVKWSEIPIKSPVNAAKSYAKTHGLPWPPQASSAGTQ